MQVIIDGSGTILQVSDSAEALLGYSVRDKIGESILDFVHPDDLSAVAILLEQVTNLADHELTIDLRILTADSQFQWFEVLPKLMLATHGVIILTARNITERRLTDEALVLEKEQFRAMAESAPIVIFRFRTDGTCSFVNERWTTLSGQPISEALGSGWVDTIRRREFPRLVELVNTQEHGTHEMHIYRPSGERRSTIVRWARIYNDGQDGGTIATIEDVTERKALEARLVHQTRHDALTGLANRVLLRERLVALLNASAHAPSSGRLAVLFCDLDRFKLINDSLGHDAGDQLLVEVAQRLRREFSDVEVVARFGGDEFVLLARVEDEYAADNLAARLEIVLQAPVQFDSGHPYVGTASIGVALSTANSTAESLLSDADTAMYQAKKNGRGRIAAFDDEIRQQVVDRLATENDLRLGIASGCLFLEYQPIVDAKTGRVHSLEALVRWNHPTRGRLGPDAFIEIAEESGLINPLGDWVLAQAVREVGALEDVLLNVNLSVRQIQSPGIAEKIISLLHEHSFDPKRLVVEITESVLATNIERTAGVLATLRRTGIQIAVDDFGTGYSSLQYLAKLPVDTLKIDRSFVQQLDETNGNSGAIIAAIIELAHALQMTTTAEGVETVAQQDVLVASGCDFLQGYLLGRPVDIGQLRSCSIAR